MFAGRRRQLALFLAGCLLGAWWSGSRHTSIVANSDNSLFTFDASLPCVISHDAMRLHRLHMIFNDRGRHDQTIRDPGSTQNPSLALILSLADASHSSRVRWTLAETWDDLNFGTQYLLTGIAASTRDPVLTYVRDDLRHQPVVLARDAPYSGRITIIIALYNRGAQLLRWVEATAAIPEIDRRDVRLCVADFTSDDVDVRAALERTGISFSLLVLSGAFSKTEALNACLHTVDDPNELIFTTDVDVMLPNDAISRIRRYARPGERLYAPVVWYDDCEWSGNSGQSNCWGDGGYGLVAFSLSDARRVGMYDAARFNEREGFEDTDFLLKLLRLPRVMVRKRERDFVHLAHERSAWKDAKNRGEYKDVDFPPVC